jgi:hypothetical protein
VSVMVIRIWSFDCDQPRCPAIEDVGEHYLPDAVKALEHYGWTVTGRGRKARHFCPQHPKAATS